MLGIKVFVTHDPFLRSSLRMYFTTMNKKKKPRETKKEMGCKKQEI